MKLNFIFFPAPKKRYSKEQHLGELIWIPKLLYDNNGISNVTKTADNEKQELRQFGISPMQSPHRLTNSQLSSTSKNIRFASPQTPHHISQSSMSGSNQNSLCSPTSGAVQIAVRNRLGVRESKSILRQRNIPHPFQHSQTSTSLQHDSINQLGMNAQELNNLKATEIVAKSISTAVSVGITSQNFNSQPCTRAAFLRDTLKKEETIEQSFLCDPVDQITLPCNKKRDNSFINSKSQTLFLQRNRRETFSSALTNSSVKNQTASTSLRTSSIKNANNLSISKINLNGKENTSNKPPATTQTSTMISALKAIKQQIGFSGNTNTATSNSNQGTTGTSTPALINQKPRNQFQSLKQRSNEATFFNQKKPPIGSQKSPTKIRNIKEYQLESTMEENILNGCLKSPKDIQKYTMKSFQTFQKQGRTGTPNNASRTTTHNTQTTIVTEAARNDSETGDDDCLSEIEQEQHNRCWYEHDDCDDERTPLSVLNSNRIEKSKQIQQSQSTSSSPRKGLEHQQNSQFSHMQNSKQLYQKDGQAKKPHLMPVKQIQSFQSPIKVVQLMQQQQTAQHISKEQLCINPAEQIKHIPCLYLRSPTPSNYVMIYFHGNGEDISLSYEMTNHLRETLKVNILSVEYSGYGIYGGDTDENEILKDTKYVYNYLTKILSFSNQNILVMGRSIGSGPATWLAAHETVRALVLVSPFTSIRAVVKHVAGSLAQHLIQERFENSVNIKNVTCPTFIVHGQMDSLIPFSQSQTLHDFCAGPKQVIFPQKMTHIELNFNADLTIPLKEFLAMNGLNIVIDNYYLAPHARITLPAYLYDEPLESN